MKITKFNGTKVRGSLLQDIKKLVLDTDGEEKFYNSYVKGSVRVELVNWEDGWVSTV